MGPPRHAWDAVFMDVDEGVTRRIRVLIADDSPLVRVALRRFLVELPGIDVVGVSRDGADALVLAARLQPDAVLLDLAMPNLDGLEATRLLKGRTPSPAVVICTIDDSEEVRAAARRAGADAVIRKRDLARRVEGVLSALLLGARAGGAWEAVL
jgi:DNA-binding NarL/FixJ family response regulator